MNRANRFLGTWKRGWPDCKALKHLEEAVSRISTPTVPCPAEIRRQYPTTNWQACKTLIDKASRAAEQLRVELKKRGADDVDLRADSAFTETLNAPIKMLTFKQVLDRFGAPNDVSVTHYGFEWEYHSPEKSEGYAKEGIRITFMHGYVSEVEAWR